MVAADRSKQRRTSRSGGDGSAATDRRNVALDDLDRQIIDVLASHGRITNRAVAEALDLSNGMVSARIRRLNELGVVAVTAVSDWEAAGYAWCAAVCIKVEGRPPRDVADKLAAVPEVFAVALVHGRYDLVAHALFRDRDDVHRVLKKALPEVQGVRDVDANLITRTVGFRTGVTGQSVRTDTALEFPAPPFPLDNVDLGLIDALAADARQSNREIGRQLGVSEGTIRARLRRLEDAKLVRVVSMINRAALGEIGANAFIGIRVDGGTVDLVAQLLADQPEVYMVNVTVGLFDIMLTAVTPDRTSLAAFTSDRLPSIPGVWSTEVLEVVGVTKNNHRWARLL